MTQIPIPPSESAVSLRGLTKVFGSSKSPSVAVDRLSLDVPRGAFYGLVGRNGIGKSTLFNALTASEVYAANQLFATLDPTLRRLQLDDLGPVVLADTVGFIRNLPHGLVAAFRATLEEVGEADLILHVRDISHPETEEQAADVGDILDGLGVDEDVALIEVWNKIDALSGETRLALCRHDARTEGVQAISEKDFIL